MIRFIRIHPALIAAASLLLLLATRTWAAPAPAHDDASPIPIKAVVVTMFEIGEDEGDTAGEFQLWKKRAGLTQRLSLPGAYHDAWLNPKTGVLGVVTGVGTANAVSTIAAVGYDPRLDLSHAYWVVAGISGGDPADTSLGSAVWADYVVDGDLAHEIDAREIPDNWSTGYLPMWGTKPYQKPIPGDLNAVQRFRLNAGLTDWAYTLTRNVKLPDADDVAAYRDQFQQKAARRPPRVQKGDNLAAMTFWHGDRLNDWANRWVKYWTDGQGEFVTSAMEDTGTLLELHRLDTAGRVDADRVLVLRTVSNFTVPHAGQTPAESLASEQSGYSGLALSVESAYRVASPVVSAIVDGWPTYRDQMPGTGERTGPDHAD
ncbi:purine nucleoside permease [Salinisphaera sp. Q1T1-3]|uniref:purine-nucleoside phosphorylase n=1 Tax=Salinisphaera sp. Q1T1-3 TaxID=2321229 RepID=UPI0018F4F924|nr:purine nucleoside permease [Salinisphaera sp. Q1T1-3]